MRIITSQVVKDELKVAFVVGCSTRLPCEMAVVSHQPLARPLTAITADPAVCCIMELAPIFICEEHLGKIEFPMNILDFNEDLSNIFILAVFPIDDWLL